MNTNLQSFNPTILVVDDNSNNVKIIALLLRELNYKIAIATNGASAIDLAKRVNPDLILMDVMMPGMDGFEASQIIKKDEGNKNLPIIFLTALGDKANLVKGFEIGGVDYITKPFNKEELISRINTHLELKFTRDQLIETTNNLRELNALKDKLFSVIGHDLRSPLGSVKLSLELLTMGIIDCKSNDFQEMIKTLLHSTDEVVNLLDNLLGWAKSQSGTLSVVPERLNLKEILQSNFLLLKGQLMMKDIQYTEIIEDGFIVFADMYILKTVLRNLVSNAIKFTPNGGKISISATSENGLNTIEVNDNGVGIDSDTAAKLFDEKSHITTFGTNNEVGSGIGLKLCKNFIEKLDGKIWVESEVGKGSCFYVQIMGN